MAFAKAQRTLELCTNYNPPPNHYQHQNKVEIDDEEIHTTFAKQGRFKNQLKKTMDEPGPGHYYQPSKTSSKGHKIVAPKAAYSSDNQIKINSIPSIPKQSTARAYEQLAPGILILHEAEGQEGEIGPGSYDPKPIFKKGGAAHKFSTTPYDRFQKKKEQEPKIVYTRPQQPKINIRQKLKQPEKKIINQTDLCLEMIILREKQMKLDEIPPPGYYHNERVVSGFNSQQKPKQLQFLAGKAKRFEQAGKQSGLGPGQYTLISVNKLSEGGFFSKANRNTSFGIETKDNPGPGAYIEEQKHQQQVSATKHPPIFSSGCVRFINTAKQQTPGPGQYNIDKFSKRRKIRTIRVPLQSKTSKSFNTKQQLNDQSNSRYFSNQNSKLRGATANSKLRRQSSSFASRMKRFKDTETSFVGPGLYEINSKIRTKFNRKSNIIEQQQRFKYNQNVSEIGPGYYNVNDNNIKSKKTHDILFK